jgi:cell division protein FtsI (penicillin-binding protein 3)
MIPIENPRYLICVLLDEPTAVQYGGVIAAPVFRHVALNIMAYHGLLPESDDPLVRAVAMKEEERKAAGKTRGGPRSATELLRRASGREKPAGETVRAGREEIPLVPETAKIQAGPDTVPTVVGMGIRNAVEVFAGHGVVPVLKGRGSYVVRQTPEPGSNWPDGKKECTLWLEERTS